MAQDVEGRKTVTPISAGCYGSFPAGAWHGFMGDRLRSISGQIPDIGDRDYVLSETEHAYLDHMPSAKKIWSGPAD